MKIKNIYIDISYTYNRGLQIIPKQGLYIVESSFKSVSQAYKQGLLEEFLNDALVHIDDIKILNYAEINYTLYERCINWLKLYK